MPGKLDPKALPKWQRIRGGSDPQPGDERGQWMRESLVRMNNDFTAAMQRAIADGRERLRGIPNESRAPPCDRYWSSAPVATAPKLPNAANKSKPSRR